MKTATLTYFLLYGDGFLEIKPCIKKQKENQPGSRNCLDIFPAWYLPWYLHCGVLLE